MCKSGLYDVGSQRIRCGLEIVKNKICVKLTSKNIVSKKKKNLHCFVLFCFGFFFFVETVGEGMLKAVGIGLFNK